MKRIGPYPLHNSAGSLKACCCSPADDPGEAEGAGLLQEELSVHRGGQGRHPAEGQLPGQKQGRSLSSQFQQLAEHLNSQRAFFFFVQTQSRCKTGGE